jgi:hypothetical protein
MAKTITITTPVASILQVVVTTLIELPPFGCAQGEGSGACGGDNQTVSGND